MTFDKLLNLSVPQVPLCTMEVIPGLLQDEVSYVCVNQDTTWQRAVLHRLAAITIASAITTVSWWVLANEDLQAPLLFTLTPRNA